MYLNRLAVKLKLKLIKSNLIKLRNIENTYIVLNILHYLLYAKDKIFHYYLPDKCSSGVNPQTNSVIL